MLLLVQCFYFSHIIVYCTYHISNYHNIYYGTGKMPARGQEMSDHYMAPPSTTSPVLACMRELQSKCWWWCCWYWWEWRWLVIVIVMMMIVFMMIMIMMMIVLFDWYLFTMISITTDSYCFITDECFKLGIPLRTRHREVAPNQYEFAPLFGTVTTQIDQNLMV